MFVYGGNKDLCIFSPGKTVTEITPQFPRDLQPCPKVLLHVFLTISGLVLLSCCYGPESTCTRMRTGSVSGFQVTDVIGNHGAGVVPNLIQQKLEGVFSVSGVFYLEKHHIIKTIL